MNQYPMNDLRNPLGKAFYELTQQVEALGGSPELTAVVVAIGALRDQVAAALATKPQAGDVAQDSDPDCPNCSGPKFCTKRECNEPDAARTRGEGGA